MRQERFCSCAYYTMLLVPQSQPITMQRSPLISITHGEYEFLNHSRLIPRVRINQNINGRYISSITDSLYNFSLLYFMSTQKYLKSYRSFAILKVIHTHIDCFTSCPGFLTIYTGFNCLQDKKTEGVIHQKPWPKNEASLVRLLDELVVIYTGSCTSLVS